MYSLSGMELKDQLQHFHANNDIAVEWKEAFEKEGLKVDVCLEGLGEVPEIQNLYMDKK